MSRGQPDRKPLCPRERFGHFNPLMRRDEQRRKEMTKRVASKHDPPPKFSHRIVSLGREEKKEREPITPLRFSKGNVSLMCRLLMRPNERISTHFKSSYNGPVQSLCLYKWTLKMLFVVINRICCQERNNF